jgi:hypothetical protein
MEETTKYKIYHYPSIRKLDVFFDCCLNQDQDEKVKKFIAIQTDDKEAFNKQLKQSLDIVFGNQQYCFFDGGFYINFSLKSEFFYLESKRTLDKIIDDNS